MEATVDIRAAKYQHLPGPLCGGYAGGHCRHWCTCCGYQSCDHQFHSNLLFEKESTLYAYYFSYCLFVGGVVCFLAFVGAGNGKPAWVGHIVIKYVILFSGCNIFCFQELEWIIPSYYQWMANIDRRSDFIAGYFFLL